MALGNAYGTLFSAQPTPHKRKFPRSGELLDGAFAAQGVGAVPRALAVDELDGAVGAGVARAHAPVVLLHAAM